MPNVYSSFNDDAISTLDATGISDRIRRGEISLDEALDAATNRARLSQSTLNAIVVEDFERVKIRSKNNLKSINREPSQRKLNVPAFLKDNINLAGLPTRFGSNATSSRPVTVTDDLVHQLHAAGLHFIGKSTTPPFGFGCSTEFDDGTPPTRNPWNLNLSAGGSSGGAAALVAAGVVPIAHGNDGGGSIRIPAALCGIVGLKPSRGRLIRQKRTKSMPIDIISDGVLTRTVRDTANFYYEAERYFTPNHLKPIGLVEGPAKQRLRIGFVFDSILTRACPETRMTVESTAKILSNLGHMVEETSFQSEDRFARDFTLYWSFLAFTVDHFGTSIFSHDFDRRRLDSLTVGLSRNFKRNLWQSLSALIYLRNIKRKPAFTQWRYDVVLSPVLARPAPHLGYLNPGVPFDQLLQRLQEYVGYTPVANTLGTPAISVPMGRSSQNVPIGIQISAPLGEERRLLELAFELEMAKPWPVVPHS
jgi:amidase